MKNTEFIPADFDTHGRLRLPFLFWCVLLLQARTWVLFLMAGASRQQGDALLNLFYPDHDNFWLGLLPGIPAVLAFLISGHRQRFPRLWPMMRWLLVPVKQPSVESLFSRRAGLTALFADRALQLALN